MSLAVLTLSCLLWIASLWSCRSAWDAIWERDWMELTWSVSRTAMLVFLAIAAGTAHAHWNEVQSIDPNMSPSHGKTHRVAKSFGPNTIVIDD